MYCKAEWPESCQCPACCARDGRRPDRWWDDEPLLSGEYTRYLQPASTPEQPGAENASLLFHEPRHRNWVEFPAERKDANGRRCAGVVRRWVI